MLPIKSSQTKLLTLPMEDWKKSHTYESLLLVNGKQIHDSGWQIIVIIGCRFEDGKAMALERVAHCDDINIIYHPDTNYRAFRMEMTRYGVIHLWSRYVNFRIPAGQCSSCDIELLPVGA